MNCQQIASTPLLVQFMDQPLWCLGRRLLQLCLIPFATLCAGVLTFNNAYAYQVTPIVAGAVITPEGLALPFQNLETASTHTFTIPLASGSPANIQANVLPSSFRIAAWAARVVTPGSGGALSPFMREYLADRYIYPADDGGFVQATRPRAVDASGVVKRVTPGVQRPADPGYIAPTPMIQRAIDVVFPNDVIVYIPFDPESGLARYIFPWECVDGSFQPGAYSVPRPTPENTSTAHTATDWAYTCNLVPSPIRPGEMLGQHTGVYWQEQGQSQAEVVAPSPDPAAVESESLPYLRQFPATANEPIPVEATFPQPNIDGEAYTDPSTGNRVKTRYLVEPGPGLASLANGGQIAPPTVNVTETTVSASAEYPPKNNGGCNAGVPNEGNPINASIGNKWQHEVDIESVAAPGFARMYNSNPATGNTNLGNGWTHTYSRSISLQPVGSGIRVSLQDGKSYAFNTVAGGWAADADIPDQLVEIKDANAVRTGWRYTVAADDSVETYSTSGKLLSIADRSGRTQTLVYDLPSTSGGDDDPETLDTVTDDTGRQLVFTYDEQKRISTVTDPLGGSTSYGYDAQNNLISVTFPDGSGKTYHYNEPEHTAGADLPHALTGITDENGDRYAIFTYDANGKAISTGHAGGADLFTMSYNADGSTTVTDPIGAQRTHSLTTILVSKPINNDACIMLLHIHPETRSWPCDRRNYISLIRIAS